MSNLIEKWLIKRYVKKLNNKDLNTYYLNLLKSSNSPNKKLALSFVRKEMLKRGKQMANLLQKTKYINLVVRKLDLNISERDKQIKRWCDDNCEQYAYIYHFNDLSIEHVHEQEHLHLVGILKESKRLGTTLNSFCESVNLTTLGVEIDKCNSVEGSIQYLIHKNDPQKTQHDISEIVSNIDAKELIVIMDTDTNTLTPERLRQLVKNSSSNFELIKALGIERYNRYRKVISDIRDDFRIWDY